MIQSKQTQLVLRNASTQTGFTLIEMVVTLAVSILLIGGGVTAFLRFNERQSVTNSAREFANVLKIAESKTQAGILGACNTQLEAYEITFDTGVIPNEMYVREVCATGDTGTPVTVTYTLDENTQLSFNPATTYIRYKILTGGVLFSGGSTSVQARFNHINSPTSYYVVTVSEGGDVTDGSWQ